MCHCHRGSRYFQLFFVLLLAVIAAFVGAQDTSTTASTTNAATTTENETSEVNGTTTLEATTTTNADDHSETSSSPVDPTNLSISVYVAPPNSPRELSAGSICAIVIAIVIVVGGIVTFLIYWKNYQTIAASRKMYIQRHRAMSSSSRALGMTRGVLSENYFDAEESMTVRVKTDPFTL